MAQSANNLTFGISVDGIGKVKADLALVNAEIRKFQQLLNQAVKRGDAAAVDTYHAALQRVFRQQELLRPSTQGLNTDTRRLAAGFEIAGVSANQFARQMSQIARAAGLSVPALRSARLGLVGLVAAEALRNLNAAVDKINELSKLSKEVGVSPQFLQGVEAATKKAGGTTEDAAGSMRSLFNTIREGRKEALEAGKDLGGPSILRGNQAAEDGISGMTTVLHGANPVIKQFRDNIKGLGLDLTSYGTTQKENERLAVDIARAIVERSKDARRTEADIQTRGLFGGKGLEEMLPILTEAAKGATEMNKALGVTPLTDEDIARAKAYAEAVVGIENALSNLRKTIVVEFVPPITNALNKITEALKTEEFGANVKQGLKEIENTAATTRHEIELLQDAINGLFGWIAKADEWIKRNSGKGEALAKRILGGEGGDASTIDFTGGAQTAQASGGYIRGPGTATSDSILARLSNGEYVINAKSARRLGLGYLNRLNRFAEGGATEYTGFDDLDFTGAGLDYTGYGGTGVSMFKKIMFQLARYPSRGGKLLGRSTGRIDETDADYFKRTGFHFGQRAGETPFRTGDPGGNWRPLMPGGSERSLRGAGPYAVGGLVGGAPIPFASGGLVGASSSGGRPVHLHLGSASFALSGSSGVVGALVTEAHHQQMRSAGTKPSWLAGRSGGR
jgi:hypothetical protein